jgi:protein-S-isoprenylcysteine O-methyltransferase Ste14
MMSRWLGVLLGFGAHAMLGVTVWFLFPFLMDSSAPESKASPAWWSWDILLIVQFGLSHSVLLYPPVRDWLERYLHGALHGVFFTLITCISLLLLVLTWQQSSIEYWRLEGWERYAIQAAYLASWVALAYTVSLTGAGFQTGWTPFWAWLRGKPRPRRRFEIRGAYRWLRHPVYLSFLGLVWFTPTMTLDRALLTGLMTGYVFLGSYFKDRRLLFFLGDAYRDYQSEVPGYPVIGLGPLGRVPNSTIPSTLAHQIGEPAA